MKIIIYATAAVDGGALSLLNDLLEYANDDIDNEYTVCVNEKLNNEVSVYNNLTFLFFDTKAWHKRVYFDFIGFKKNFDNKDYCLVINLQNIPVRTQLKQILYLHQPLPFSDIKLNILEKRNRKLIFYKYLYGLIIKFNSCFIDHCLVQTEWMRKAVIDKLNLSEKKISIIRPVIDIDLNKILKNENENENENTFIYPAASYSYKNHIILVESLNMIGVDFLFQNKITVIFTLDRDENSKLFDRIKKYNLQEIIKFTGNIPRYDVLNYIYNAKALLFPSRLETFGIPLIEAVKFNSNIIVSDLPYAHDVLDGYENVKYCNPDSPEDWSEAIKFAINLKENKLNQGFELNSGWRELSSIISTL